jgi:hypothetical protein
VFGRTLVLFSLRGLLAFNIALAVFGPAIMILLVAIQSLIVYNRRHRQNGVVPGTRQRLSEWFMDLSWLKTIWKWTKFWLALVVTVGLQVLLVVGYVNLNPFVSRFSVCIRLIADVVMTDCVLTTASSTDLKPDTRIPLHRACLASSQ